MAAGTETVSNVMKKVTSAETMLHRMPSQPQPMTYHTATVLDSKAGHHDLNR